MAKDLAIVLNNGSVNSAVVTALAAQKYRPVMLHAEMRQASPARAQRRIRSAGRTFQAISRAHAVRCRFFAGIGSTARPTARLRPIRGIRRRWAADARAASADRGGDALRRPLSSRRQFTWACASEPPATTLPQATEYVQIWNEMIQIPVRSAGCGSADAAAGAGTMAGHRRRVSGRCAVRPNLELPGRERRAVLGMPRMPSARGGVSASGQAGSASSGVKKRSIKVIAAGFVYVPSQCHP